MWLTKCLIKQVKLSPESKLNLNVCVPIDNFRNTEILRAILLLVDDIQRKMTGVFFNLKQTHFSLKNVLRRILDILTD